MVVARQAPACPAPRAPRCRSRSSSTCRSCPDPCTRRKVVEQAYEYAFEQARVVGEVESVTLMAQGFENGLGAACYRCRWRGAS